MQALCQWEVQGDESSAALGALLDELGAKGEAAIYATWILGEFWKLRETVDKTISGAATYWNLNRISFVERNLLRVATTEMLGHSVPPRVAINEAVEIAREYGGADSPRFVNGVLDAVLQQMKEAGAVEG